MKIYGYESEDSDLIGLEEITFHASVDELRSLVAFITNTISLIEIHGSQFGHEHFNDFVKNNESKAPDIIIMATKDNF
ncbi:hypothetical protein [Xenorhabdus cabanillasii]|uniref:Uncharacterized protein n=1 Tax=Xenorhabdus cabanillasii JM26 TaxID=1427517 RepID=W1JAC2_9GAMM|nr:hypothetical protein [Xenorhabdus cabanillasii]PHM75349.1 hypothetical protein Xcab_04171 [Xenorhabdus cabanillasii JM26]CDL86420.1 conserved hypothetical protein [Xenorhabdus cabanillasii JM26]